jgi:hypothetical protein
MVATMRDMSINQLPNVMAIHPADGIAVECLHGHFFKLDLFSIEGGCTGPSLIGGALHCGPDRIALDFEHARQLADRVRAAIDNCVAGSIIHRPACRDGGH